MGKKLDSRAHAKYTTSAMKQVRLSASSVQAYKSCPTRYRNAYVEGIRPSEDTESKRVGTNWHALHEVYQATLEANGRDKEAALAAALDHLNEAYGVVPDAKSLEEWETERVVLTYSFMGWLWHHEADDYTLIATEQQFALPLLHPKTRMPLPLEEVVRVGKIDRLVRNRNGAVMGVEYKSTSRSIDSDSTYWDRLRMDTQVSFYVLAGRDMGLEIEGTLYDVWRRPTISPKLLTQAETKAFIETGDYCGLKFQVSVTLSQGVMYVTVNGAEAEVKEGKSANAIRETPEMFGARLLADIYERPDHYFQRREIARTDVDLRAFEREIYHIYQSIKSMTETGHWWKNETQCEAVGSFKCDFCKLCYTGRNAPFADVPDGFRRIQDVTIGLTEE